MSIINTSIFDLFKIGPGPSSSHTIGPMRASYDFFQSVQNLSLKENKDLNNIEVHLYGSLSATGKGHGTDKAVLAGLLGWRPDLCDSDKFIKLFEDPNQVYQIKIKDISIPFTRNNIIFDDVKHSFPYQNTMVVKLLTKNGVVFEKEYYSIGGGFIKIKGSKDIRRGAPKYPYSNMADLIDLLSEHKISLSDLIIANEEAITGAKRKDIINGVENIISVMLDSVDRGLHSEGVLPGSIGLAKKAHILYKRRDFPDHIMDRFLLLLSAAAMAVAEENASHHKVVTAPTLGSSGVIPAIIYMLKNHLKISHHELCEGLMAASAIGFIIKHNASIAGAEVGCQGEIGVASSMGAALLTYINKHSIHRVANAAEIAMEHCLGWTCDPVGGYVQIPCIERNAIGAGHAFNAYILAIAGEPKKQKVTFDEVVKVMLETGRDMPVKYKETSSGGLAKCGILC